MPFLLLRIFRQLFAGSALAVRGRHHRHAVSIAAVLLTALAPCLPMQADAQSWIDRYEKRASKYTADQPHWAGPVVLPVPMLVQVYRTDFVRTITPAGARNWNLGANKGLQFVPLPRTEFTITPPPYFVRSDGISDGIGDITLAVKFRIAAAPETRGNYIVTAMLAGTLPTGARGNGLADAAITPTLFAGKGHGKWDVITSIGAQLPTDNISTNGRVLTANTAVQFHAARYLWPELESNTTTWFGSARDGKVQSFLTPGVVVGRLPYKPNERDRRRGISLGVAMQFAVTPFHATDHHLQFTTRFHF